MNTPSGDLRMDDRSKMNPLSLGLAVRGIFGGILMGLANLVPGISGGTMLLAAGVYPEFVNSVAAVTTLQRRLRPWLIAALIGVPAVVAIGAGAGFVRDSVLEHRWLAYSLFIGLTLGGVPLLWRMLRPFTVPAIVASIIAFAVMGGLAVIQGTAPASTDGGGGLGGLFIAGFAGSAAMVLPGVSGGYLLLLLGQYVPVLDAIDAFTTAARAGDGSALVTSVWPICSIGFGVAMGVVIVSNAMKWLLTNFRQATLGALLGLLLGAIFGLWPFREAYEPPVGSSVRGTVITTVEQAQNVPLKYRPTQSFSPSGGVLVGALGCVLLGFATCWGIGRVGATEAKPTSTQE